MRCPKCGASGYSRKTKTPEWRCRKCGHEWDDDSEPKPLTPISEQGLNRSPLSVPPARGNSLPSGASICPTCEIWGGAPIKTRFSWMWLLFWFLCGLVTLVVYLLYQQNKDTRRCPNCYEDVFSSNRSPILVTGDQICQEFIKNPTAAKTKYRGRLIALTGVVTGLNSYNWGIPTVALMGSLNGPGFAIHCRFHRDDYVAGLDQLEMGRTMRVIGRVGWITQTALTIKVHGFPILEVDGNIVSMLR